MSTNLPLAFTELLAGGLLVVAGYKGSTISQVVRGDAGGAQSFTGSSSAAGAPAVAGGGSVAPNAAGFANPFAKAKSFTPERTDQGVDASMAPGSPILAPAASTLVHIMPDWYQGQPLMVLRIDAGQMKGKLYYLAEQISPSLQIGQSVGAGQEIATYASSGTGIEMGWAANASGQTLAQATTGYTEGAATPAGQEFRSFLRSIGAPV